MVVSKGYAHMQVIPFARVYALDPVLRKARLQYMSFKNKAQA